MYTACIIMHQCPTESTAEVEFVVHHNVGLSLFGGGFHITFYAYTLLLVIIIICCSLGNEDSTTTFFQYL